MSLLDNLFGYNQVLVAKEDRYKTTFTTIWDTIKSILNASATFQREMDFTLRELTGMPVVVYLDDLTIFSRDLHDHVMQFQPVFQKCRD